MNTPKHTTRARRTAAPSTGPAPTTQDGAAGAGTPTAPMVTNARESITTGTDATTAARADSTPSTRTGDAGAMVRAILSTLAADTAAALVGLLVAWFRLLLAMPRADREAAVSATDRMMDDATRLDAEPHARAIVAALAFEAPHNVAREATDTRPGSREQTGIIVCEALATLAALNAPQTGDDSHRALVRAILSTVDITVRVAVLRALAAWWRALVVLSVEGGRALESARIAHDAVESAAPWNVGAACVAVWSGAGLEEMHSTAVGNGTGSAHFIAEVSTAALEDIAVMLGELEHEPPPAAVCGASESNSAADGLDGSRGAAVLRKCLATAPTPGVRSRLAVSLMNAATASEDPRAALAAEAAVLVARDEGADPRHTLHLLFIAASEAAQLARRASIEGTQGARVDASANTLRLVARLVGGELRASVEALNIAVAAVEAFGGAR